MSTNLSHDLYSPHLGGLSTTLLSTLPLEMSLAAEVVSILENKTYSLEYIEGAQPPSIDLD